MARETLAGLRKDLESLVERLTSLEAKFGEHEARASLSPSATETSPVSITANAERNMIAAASLRRAPLLDEGGCCRLKLPGHPFDGEEFTLIEKRDDGSCIIKRANGTLIVSLDEIEKC